MTTNIQQLLEEIETKALLREKEKQNSLFAQPANPGLTGLQVLIDSREQVGNRYVFNYPSITKVLKSGDYTLSDYEWQLAIERKELNDFISTIIHHKERFNAELERLQAYENKAIFIENTYSAILNHFYTSQALPQCIEGLAASLSFRWNISIFYLESFELSNRLCEKYLIQYYKKKNIWPALQLDAQEEPKLRTIEQSCLQFTLQGFIEQITTHKDTFKEVVKELNKYPSRLIILECKYSDILRKVYKAKVSPETIEDIIVNLIVYYNLPVVFMENNCIATHYRKKHLERYLSKPEIIKQPRKKRNG